MKMNKKFLFLFISVILLSLLVILSFIIKPPFISIENISAKNIGEKISTKIITEKVLEKNDFILIKNSNISLVIFDSNKMNITQNNTLEIEGKVSSYKDGLEIVADKIKCLKC